MDFWDGVVASLVVAAVIGMSFFAGLNVGKSDITGDCQRFGEFDRLTASYICTPKAKSP